MLLFTPFIVKVKFSTLCASKWPFLSHSRVFRKPYSKQVHAFKNKDVLNLIYNG